MNETKTKSPAYQWYAKDYMTDTRVILLTLAEEGAYRKLIDLCFLQQGELTADNRELAALVGKECTVEMIKKIKKFFVISENKTMRHKRVDSELEKQKTFREKVSKAGKASASKRWGKDESLTSVTPMLQHSDNKEGNTSVALHLQSAFTSTINTISPLAEEIFEKIKTSKRPFSDVVMLANRPGYDDIQKLIKPDEEWDKLLEKWNYKILEGRWKWTDDFTADFLSLHASMRSYAISWAENLTKRKTGAGGKTEKPVAVEDTKEFQDNARKEAVPLTYPKTEKK